MNPTLSDSRSTVGKPPEVPARSRQWPPQTEASPNAWAWWLWPHLLSLDAPAVALLWQRWWAHAAGVTLPLSREIILGLGVWLIYLADRLADAAKGGRRGEVAARHRFSARFLGGLLPATAGLAVILACATLTALPGAEFRSGLGLLALAAGYFWLIHSWPGRGWSEVLPKEAAVGGIFSAGTVFFVVCRAPRLPTDFWVSVGLFAAACFLNCALITKWEREETDVREPSSLLNAFPRFSARLHSACVLLALVALATSLASMTWNSVPVAASALLLAGLDSHAPKMPVDTLRVLADAVLLTPLIGLICLRAT